MDPLLVYTVSVVAMSTMAVVFVVNRILHPSPQAGPWWELAFLSGVLCATAYFIGQRTGDVGWTVSVGNATMVFTLGAAWAGCVVFNGRGARVRAVCSFLVIGVSLAIGVISVLPSEYGTKYAGAVEKGIALAAFSLLALIECLQRPLRDYLGARVMAVVFALHLSYLVPRSLVYLTLGPTSGLFTAAFNTAITTGMNVVFTVIVEAAMLGIQAQHRRRVPTRSGFRHYPDVFPRGHAKQVLDGPLLVVGVDLWASLRQAYGIDLANGLSLDLARAVAAGVEEAGDAVRGAERRTEEPQAEVWRLPEGRFAVQMGPGTASSDSSARTTVERIRSEFAARAALPEGRPTISAALVLPGGVGAAEPDPVTAGTALAAAAAEFERRQGIEIEWTAVVRSDPHGGASALGSGSGSGIRRPGA